jgi:hypothetical protein
MEPVTIGTAAVGLLAPYLVEAGKGTVVRLVAVCSTNNTGNGRCRVAPSAPNHSPK